MAVSNPEDPRLAETAAGAVQGGGDQDATTRGPRPETGDPDTGTFDGGEFVLDHDADPPEAEQPTTS